MDKLTPTWLERLLSAVGAHLQANEAEAAIVVVGGATLSILGIVDRATKDVDVIAQARREGGEWALIPPVPLPRELQAAVELVARDHGLSPGWLNTEVGAQWPHGLPESVLGETEWRRYGALWVGFAGRRTLIALKMFAAVDGGPHGVHYQDLLALQPTLSELREAAEWVNAQDASEHFPALVQGVIANVERDLQGN